MRVVSDRISLSELTELAEARYGDLVKAVVDIDREIMAVGEGMHADEEAALLSDGSRQTALWGINLYPAEHGSSGFVEFESLVNLRPGMGNRTRSVEDPRIRARIVEIVDRLVVP
jgi:hypothetical protein